MTAPMTPERVEKYRRMVRLGYQVAMPCTDLAQILLRMDTADAEVDRLQAAVKFLHECNEDTGRIAERAEAEVARLRAQVADALARSGHDANCTCMQPDDDSGLCDCHRAALASGDQGQP